MRSYGALAIALLGVGWLARRARRHSFEGKVALVTGGGRGLGLAMARVLAKKGAYLVLTERDAQTLARARAYFAEQGVEVMVRPCDVTDRTSVRQLVEAVVARFGGIDVLVNGAGVIQIGPLETLNEDDFARALATHFWGPYRVTSEVLPFMRSRGDGSIVNIASVGGVVSVPHLLPYGTSKFALVGWSEGLAAEVAKEGIRVTTVCPGLMRTGSARQAEVKGDREKEYAWFSVSDATPLVSMSADRAAKRIVRAIEHGERSLRLGWTAKLASFVHGFAPGFVIRAFGLVNRLLPKARGPADRFSTKGAAIRERKGFEIFRALDAHAVARNNER